MTHRWFGDGYVLVAFRSGTVVVISTHVSEMNREVARMDVLSSGIDAFCHSPRLGKFAACGGNVIKVYDATADGGVRASDPFPCGEAAASSPPPYPLAVGGERGQAGPPSQRLRHRDRHVVDR